MPQDTGTRNIMPAPLREIEGLPFANMDWEGRISGSHILAAWISLQPAPPSRDDRNRFGTICKAIADGHTTGEIALAFMGMQYLWPFGEPPHGKGDPWTPIEFKRDFAKALAAAKHHPQIAARLEDQAFEEALGAGGVW